MFKPHPTENFDDDASDLNDSTTDLKLRRTYTSNHPVVHRALSTVSANQTLVHQQRNLLAKNFRRISVNDQIVTIDHTDADASFLLPNLSQYPEEVRNRFINSLVDLSTMNILEETNRLNWWLKKKLPSPKLYSLVTTGDGNCLLHATSLAFLAMWGFHDHSLSMRKALNDTLITSKPNNSLYRRWRWAQSVQNKKYGLVFSEQEWTEEWKSLLRLSSVEPRISQINAADAASTDQEQQVNRTKTFSIVSSSNAGGSTKSIGASTRQYYESLEEFHVYVLANNIRRPIIVYSDRVLRTNDGEAISPIEFGGIYLPLEIPPEKCHKQPVFLAFDAAHFSALVPCEQNNQSLSKVTYRIPLIDIETNDLLPIHYFVDPGPDFLWPVDEELSDEKIHLYHRFGPSRMDVLQSYLNVSEEYLSLASPLNSPTEENGTFSVEPSRSVTNTTDLSTISHETTNSVSSPTTQKKSSRQTLNVFSKLIRRTFLEPFSSNKRGSFKLQRQQMPHDSALIDPNELRRRISSPLLNPRTNTLKIVMADFQAKRPKTSDNMIKNYIDAYVNEYQQEKNKQKTLETTHEEHSRSNGHTDENQPVVTHYRSYTSTTNNIVESTINAQEKRRVIPLNNHVVPKGTSKHYDVDENDDSSLIESIPLSSNVNYVEKQNNSLKQSNSFDTAQNRTQSNNNLLANRIKSNQVNDLNVARSSQKSSSSTSAQAAQLKRQQSVEYDRNRHSQHDSESSTNSFHRRSIRINILPNSSRRMKNEPIKRS